MEVHMNRPEPVSAPVPSTGEPRLSPDYEEDFVLWLTAQAELLRARQFDALDVENLIEEIEGMVRSDRRELRHRLNLVLVHLLKCKYQPSHRSKSWVGTLREQRRQIDILLGDSPSLRSCVADYARDEYPHAMAKAQDETGLPASSFPQANPFSTAELLDPDFLP
jgi:hypothetical protein